MYPKFREFYDPCLTPGDRIELISKLTLLACKQVRLGAAEEFLKLPPTKNKCYHLWCLNDMVQSMPHKKQDSAIKKRQAIASVDVLVAFSLLVLATAVSAAIKSVVNDDLILLIYVLCVVITASICQRKTAFVSSVVSVLVYDYFFVPPVLGFMPTDITAIPVLFFMLVVALIVSELASRLKKQADDAVLRESKMQTLFHLSEDFASSDTLEDLIAFAENHIGEATGCEAIVLTPPDIEEHYIRSLSRSVMQPDNTKSLQIEIEHEHNLESLTGKVARLQKDIPETEQVNIARQAFNKHEKHVITGAFSPLPARHCAHGGLESTKIVLLQAEELEAAQRAFFESKEIVVEKDSGTYLRLTFIPLRACIDTVGVVAILVTKNHSYDEKFVASITIQVALAMERAFLVRAASRVAIKGQREEMRSALVRSISHHLKTPLAAILGAANTLSTESMNADETTRLELIQSIAQESNKMEAMVSNLIDMTLVQSSSGQMDLDWYSIEEIVGCSLTRLEDFIADREIVVDIPSNLPLVEMNDVLIEKVLFNLIDNAVRYSNSQDSISISSWLDDDGSHLICEVANDGKPLLNGQDNLFEKFYLGASDSTSGAGLGLQICKTIVEEHGGKIWSVPNLSNGVKFRFCLRISDLSPSTITDE